MVTAGDDKAKREATFMLRLNPNRASLTDIFPEAIGLSLVLNTFLSNFLSRTSFTIHPADLIKTDPKKNSNK